MCKKVKVENDMFAKEKTLDIDISPRIRLLLETNRTMARKYTISPDSESVIETKGEGIAGDAPRTVVEVRATIHD